ncbi:MAG: LD-carboxypeptidase [Bacteroidales bacterium]|nr:LD-carboxypeptidase [Bacteroidales bacterium]
MAENIIKPLLKPGDTVGLITPAGFIDEKKLSIAVKNIEAFGLNVFYNDSVLEKSGYLAGNDESRLKEFHSMYKNNNIKAIVCVRGGYGTTRLLDNVDFSLIKQNPKPLIGYSDITALINAIYKKTGITGFHGVVGAGNFTEYTSLNFKNLFFGNSENVVIELFEKHKETAFVINEGFVSGKLVGGNLALVVSVLGTPYDVSWQDKIIFLEDIGEAPYKIDRMLTQLISVGKFNNVKGIILGQFRGCEPEKEDEANSFSLKEVIIDRIKPMNIPSVYGFSFGHIKNQVIFPVGIKADFNTNNFSISIKRKLINEYFI